MLSRVLKRRCVFVGLKVAVDEFDEAVEVFCCNLTRLLDKGVCFQGLE
jgi:hypothetical protein